MKKNLLGRFNDFLDRYILPWPVRFLTFRVVILLTIGLLIPLIVFANNTVLVLATNSYLNTMSVAVSSIVLLYATIAEIRQKQIAELQEKRALEDHLHVTEMHNLIMQTLQNQNEEMAELKHIVAALAGKELVKKELPEGADVKSLHSLGKERFTEADVSRRLKESLHQNELLSAIRKYLNSTPAIDKD